MKNKQIAKLWYQTAYGTNPSKEELNEFVDTLEKRGFESWKKELIPVGQIQTHHDGHDASDEYVQEYIEQRKKGSEFPPIIVKKLSETSYLTVDGQHRVKAAKELDQEMILAYVGEVDETFEDRKEEFKEKIDLEAIRSYVKDPEEMRAAHVKVLKYVDEKYTEQMPWSSVYLNNSIWHFLDFYFNEEYLNE